MLFLPALFFFFNKAVFACYCLSLRSVPRFTPSKIAAWVVSARDLHLATFLTALRRSNQDARDSAHRRSALPCMRHL